MTSDVSLQAVYSRVHISHSSRLMNSPPLAKTMMAISSGISKVSDSALQTRIQSNLLPGNEFSALVEFAPSQKLPLVNPKVDARQGTIEDDEDFKSFLSLLEKGENPSKEKAITPIVSGKSPAQGTSFNNMTHADPSKPESTPLLEALITSKKHASAGGSGGKFSKHKQQHASTSKPRTKEDDAHFSRAQPIVPTGPVTLLTAAKPGSSKPTAAANPTLSPTLSLKTTIPAKETGPKGKGKGKGGETQEPKPGKAKTTPKKATTADASNVSGPAGEGGPSKPNAQKDDPAKKPLTPRKKRPAPPAQANASAAGETADNRGPEETPSSNGRGRGRGRGGGGRGGVVVVPKILTKIISEGVGAPAAGKVDLPAPNSTPVTGTSSAAGGLPATGDVAEGVPGSPPQTALDSRGGGRGGRPPFRGRGRGRGRGAPRGAAPASGS